MADQIVAITMRIKILLRAGFAIALAWAAYRAMIALYDSESIADMFRVKSAISTTLSFVYLLPLRVLTALGAFGQSPEGAYNRYSGISVGSSIALHACILFFVFTLWPRFGQKAEIVQTKKDEIAAGSWLRAIGTSEADRNTERVTSEKEKTKCEDRGGNQCADQEAERADS